MVSLRRWDKGDGAAGATSRASCSKTLRKSRVAPTTKSWQQTEALEPSGEHGLGAAHSSLRTVDFTEGHAQTYGSAPIFPPVGPRRLDSVPPSSSLQPATRTELDQVTEHSPPPSPLAAASPRPYRLKLSGGQCKLNGASPLLVFGPSFSPRRGSQPHSSEDAEFSRMYAA